MSLLEPTELLHLQVTRGNLAVNEAVRVFLLWTLQLLTVLVHVLQNPTAVGRRQLEPHLWLFWLKVTCRGGELVC